MLATGNKSEIAVGYSTIYGDAGGRVCTDKGRSQIAGGGDWRGGAMTRPCGGEVPPIPRTPSPSPLGELRPDQLDSDSLPDYELLDRILDAYVEHDCMGRGTAGIRLRPRNRGADRAVDRPRRVQASPVPPNQDHVQGVRS